MRAAIAAALLLSLGACKKDPPRGPIPDAKATAELDALWALAPEGALGGMVLSTRGLDQLEGGVGMLQAAVASAPDLAEHKRKLDELLRKTLGTTALTRAELGLAQSGGAALFAVGEGGVLVLPVGDRAKFLQRAHGTQGPDGDRLGPLLCKPLQGRYVCADTAALIDSLGKGNLKSLVASAGARGDLEVVGDVVPLRFAAAVQLERGAATVRGAVQLKQPLALLARLGSPAKPRTDAERPTGFGLVNLTGFAAEVPPLPVAGTSLDAVAKSFTGPLTVTTASGPVGFELQQGLSDPAPARALVDACAELLSSVGLQATAGGGTCKVTLPIVGALELSVVDNKVLRIATAKGAGKAVPLTALGRELSGGEWTMAGWGRGTVYNLGEPAYRQVTKLVQEEPHLAAVLLRMWTMVHELGAGVRIEGDTVRFVAGTRTVFANPDVVIAQLNAQPTQKLLDGSAEATLRRIAASRPKAPLGADLDAGPSGALIGNVAVVGSVGAAIAFLFLGDAPQAAPAESIAPTEPVQPDGVKEPAKPDGD